MNSEFRILNSEFPPTLPVIPWVDRRDFRIPNSEFRIFIVSKPFDSQFHRHDRVEAGCGTGREIAGDQADQAEDRGGEYRQTR